MTSYLSETLLRMWLLSFGIPAMHDMLSRTERVVRLVVIVVVAAACLSLSLSAPPSRSHSATTKKKKEEERRQWTQGRFSGARTPQPHEQLSLPSSMKSRHTHHLTASTHTLREATSLFSGTPTHQHRGHFNTQRHAQPSRLDRPLTHALTNP